MSVERSIRETSGASDDVYDLGDGSLAAHAASLPSEAPPSRLREIEELEALDRRRTALWALVPVLGLWWVRRTTLLAPVEKLCLSLLSVAITIGIAIGLSSLAPSAEDRIAATQAEIGQRIVVLRGLVEQRRAERGGLPSPEEWDRSAREADLRFYDPWGRVYVYDPQAREYRIGTFGRDGAAGGEGEDADVFTSFADSGPND